MPHFGYCSEKCIYIAVLGKIVLNRTLHSDIFFRKEKKFEKVV